MLSRAVYVGTHNSQGVLVLANTSGTQTFSGVISQGFAGTETFTGYTNVLIREAAGGVSVLSGANTYTGGTVVAGGTLLVNNSSGSGCGPGPVFVRGGVFGGNGSVDGVVKVGPGGALAPGMSIGTLTINNALDLAGGAVIHWEKNDTSADKIICNSVALGNDVTVMVHRLTGAIGMTETDTVFQCSVTPTDLPALDFTYGGGWTSGTLFIDGTDIKITGLIPEPAWGLGIIIVTSLARRRARLIR